MNWTNGGGWNDSGPPFPDWLQIDFGAVKTIDEVDVFTLQDNWSNSAEPTESMTFTLWGLSGYQVEYWDGSTWLTIPGASVTGNNKIWRKFTFSPISTGKIRVVTEASVDGYSRITEVEAYGPADSGGASAVYWLVADHLGTPRMIFDQSGELSTMKRHDYLPFGEELYGGTDANPGPGGRKPSQGYGCDPSDPACVPDHIRQQFTQKERDVETGLDYFLARYYSSIQGRFISPDEFTAGPEELFDFFEAASENPTFYAELTQPQSFNKYQYTFNNPLRYIDANGHEPDTPVQEPQEPDQPPPVSCAYCTLQERQRRFEDFKAWHQRQKEKKEREERRQADAMIPPASIPPQVQPVPIQPSPWAPPPSGTAHRTNRRRSNRTKHQRGNRRRAKDQGGEKADPKREGMPFHRKRPKDWKGPWPPKPPEPSIPPKPPDLPKPPPEPKKTPGTELNCVLVPILLKEVWNRNAAEGK